VKWFKDLTEEEKKRIGVDLHLCWFADCQAVWRLEEAAYHDECDTWACPACGRCFCHLPTFTQHVLDAEMVSLGLWNPFHNPPKRKRRSSDIIRGVSREDFLKFCEKYYSDLVADYRNGRINFDQLKYKVEEDSELKWVLKD